MPEPRSSDLSRRARGRWGEERAADHLRRLGFVVVDRNWRGHAHGVRGELDLVARCGDLLVFCEVKARRSAGFGGAAAAVDAAKQDRIRALAEAWLRVHPVDADRIRFDVIALDGVRLTHVDGAF